MADASEGQWAESYSEKHQRKYWKNTVTGKTSWKDPKASGDAASEISEKSARPKAAGVAQSDEWEEGYSEKHKRKYWKNKVTGKTSWKDPNKQSSADDGASVKSDVPSAALAAPAAASEGTWVEGYSEKHKRKYWKNKETGKTSWTDPNKNTTPASAAKEGSDTAADTRAASVDASADASEWVEGFNEKHQRKYWKNKTTGKTSWKNPLSTAPSSNTSVASEAVSTAIGATAAAGGGDGWVEGYSEKHQRKYWKSKATGKTSWTDPAKSSQSASASVVSASSIPPSSDADKKAAAEEEWVEGYSEKHKRKYWKNKTTGKTSWTDPHKNESDSASSKAKAGGDAASDAVEPSSASSNSVVSEWVEGYSEKHQRKYWKHKETGKTSWKDPTAAGASSNSSVVSEVKSTAAGGVEEEWVKGYSEKHKRTYWKNKATGKTSWTDPAKSSQSANASVASIPAGAEGADSEWVEGYSEKHKRNYWKNKTTGKTSWTNPIPAASAESSSAVAAAGAGASDHAASEWVESYSEKHKRKFWKNTATSKTSWKDPHQDAQSVVSEAKSSGTVGSVWVEGYSEKHKRKYWKNSETGKTSWKDPNQGEDGTAASHIDDSASGGGVGGGGNSSSGDGAAAEEWKEGYSEKHKRKYWKNTVTGKTSWTEPAKGIGRSSDEVSVVSGLESVAASQAPPQAAPQASAQWIEGYSEKYKRSFWKNSVTGKTSWAKPADDAAVASSAVAHSGTASLAHKKHESLLRNWKAVCWMMESAKSLSASSSSDQAAPYPRRLLFEMISDKEKVAVMKLVELTFSADHGLQESDPSSLAQLTNGFTQLEGVKTASRTHEFSIDKLKTAYCNQV